MSNSKLSQNVMTAAIRSQKRNKRALVLMEVEQELAERVYVFSTHYSRMFRPHFSYITMH